MSPAVALVFLLVWPPTMAAGSEKESGYDTCPVNLNDMGTEGGGYPVPPGELKEHKSDNPNGKEIVSERSKAGLFARLLKRLLKLRVKKSHAVEFFFKGKVKVVANVPLLIQNMYPPGVGPNEKTKVAHSCWAYARIIALYHSGKFDEYLRDEKIEKETTPWQVAEDVFWERVGSVKGDTYEGDHAFNPKGECPKTIALANPEEITNMGNEIVRDLISGLIDDKIYITGMGRCNKTTDHYSNVIGFTTDIDAATVWEDKGCMSGKAEKDQHVQKLDGTLMYPEAQAAFKYIGGDEHAKKLHKGQSDKYWKNHPDYSKIFTTEGRCSWNAYYKYNTLKPEDKKDFLKKFHLIIAEPWCKAELGTPEISREGFRDGPAKQNCVTGADGKIAAGTYTGADKTIEAGPCTKAGKQITEWQCLKEVRVQIRDWGEKPEDNTKEKTCKGKKMLHFTYAPVGTKGDNKDKNLGDDRLRGAPACVLGLDKHWGYAQYLWKV